MSYKTPADDIILYSDAAFKISEDKEEINIVERQ